MGHHISEPIVRESKVVEHTSRFSLFLIVDSSPLGLRTSSGFGTKEVLVLQFSKLILQRLHDFAGRVIQVIEEKLYLSLFLNEDNDVFDKKLDRIYNPI